MFLLFLAVHTNLHNSDPSHDPSKKNRPYYGLIKGFSAALRTRIKT